jgi:hypothetical protein
VSAEMSLELVPSDGINVHMGIAVRLPPVGCCDIELVRSKKDILAISALGDHEFLFNPLKPVFCIHWGLWLVRRCWGEFTGTPPNEIGGVVEVGVLAAG